MIRYIGTMFSGYIMPVLTLFDNSQVTYSVHLKWPVEYSALDSYQWMAVYCRTNIYPNDRFGPKLLHWYLEIANSTFQWLQLLAGCLTCYYHWIKLIALAVWTEKWRSSALSVIFQIRFDLYLYSINLLTPWLVDYQTPISPVLYILFIFLILLVVGDICTVFYSHTSFVNIWPV